MVETIDIPPGHPLRDRRWRPPNPIGTSEETISRVRRALWDMDPRLDVWWYRWEKPDDVERPGRWAIVYWLQRTQCWSVVFYWQGAGGEYRELSIEAIQPIRNRLNECRDESGADTRRKFKESEERAKAARDKEHMEFQKENAEYTADFAQRDQGVRGIYAPGYIRRCYVEPKDTRNTERKKRLREKGIER